VHFVKLNKYLKKAIALGPQKTAKIVYERLRSNFYENLNRKKALQNRAAMSWDVFAKKNNILDFSSFFQALRKKQLYCLNELFFDEIKVIEKADAFCNKTFDLLGSGRQMFLNIPWHDDFRLKHQNARANYSFEKNIFYKDIAIKSGKKETLERDIKLPWELSRLQHLIVFGKAYEKTQNKKYIDAFVEHIADWLDKNPYLLGPNWVCPMDVGLRAANLVVGFFYFRNAKIDESFWQRFICSLYDHLLYLENNWEIYDSITSNHYLSDLIGYFYLCWFFQGLPGIQTRATWCYQEILKEFEKQVFNEGTDYESTTYYHKLVTELFYNFYLLAPYLDFLLPGTFVEKLKKMFGFLDWCTTQSGTLIQIGDNDSSFVLAGISQALINKMKHENVYGLKHFAEFGLSIVKTENVHLSLRHHAYQPQQPTAHFHNDVGSITLAIKDIDVFVDPGSYVYTPSAVWRNYFRSVQVHNTFFIEGIEPVPFDEQLFYLNLPENKLKQKEQKLEAHHDLYVQYGLRAHRNIVFEEHAITIRDNWEILDEIQNKDALKTIWNFTVAPNIELKKNDEGWSFLYEKKEIMNMQSTLNFLMIDGFYSSAYGIKIPCKRLVAHGKDWTINAEIMIKF
jgi:hypothetical protein